MASDGGLGSSLVGERIVVGQRHWMVTKLLGEGGFSYVYLVKELTDGSNPTTTTTTTTTTGSSSHPVEGDGMAAGGGSDNKDGKKVPMVLKVTSIHSRAQRDIAEKEAKLLSRLSHPSIVEMYDTCYRQVNSAPQKSKGGAVTPLKERPQHLILMEFCEGGHALDVCNKLAANNQRFDLPTLIIAFGQICNAVSYLHAQRPPICHRDLKPVNFLVKHGAYKLCDFGSAVFGHVDLRTPKARAEAEEVIQKTTTQMFRAPEMVDLYMAKKLTQATDVWALGCCLYSMAFLQNCFEEGSNLAILSGKYTIPDDNPYGEGLVELLDRMLTSDCKARADMTEVILCLSAVYSCRPLPPRKKPSRSSKNETPDDDAPPSSKTDQANVGRYRTDGQGIQQEPDYDPTKATEGKKLASNSVAARRKRAAAAHVPPPPTAGSTRSGDASSDDPLAFSSFRTEARVEDETFGNEVGFGELKGFETKGGANEAEFFGSFGIVDSASGRSGDGFDAAFDAGAWGDTGGQEETGIEVSLGVPGSAEDPPDVNEERERKERARRRREGTGSRPSRNSATEAEAGMEALSMGDRGDASKTRRRPSKPEEEVRRPTTSQSGRSSRRGGKPRSTKEGDHEDTAEKSRAQAPPVGSSSSTSTFKKMFQRSKAPDP